MGCKPGTASVRKNRQHQLTGEIIAFFLYLNLLFRPLRLIADKFNTLQMGMVASERVFRVLDNKDIMPDEGSMRLGNSGGKYLLNMSILRIQMNVMF